MFMRRIHGHQDELADSVFLSLFLSLSSHVDGEQFSAAAWQCISIVKQVPSNTQWRSCIHPGRSHIRP